MFMIKHKTMLASLCGGTKCVYVNVPQKCKSESKHATTRSPVKVYELGTEIAEAKTHAG